MHYLGITVLPWQATVVPQTQGNASFAKEENSLCNTAFKRKDTPRANTRGTQTRARHEEGKARDNKDQTRDTASPKRGRWLEPPMFESIGMAPRGIILGPMTKTRL